MYGQKRVVVEHYNTQKKRFDTENIKPQTNTSSGMILIFCFGPEGVFFTTPPCT